jgi:hypothetical protein
MSTSGGEQIIHPRLAKQLPHSFLPFGCCSITTTWTSTATFCCCNLVGTRIGFYGTCNNPKVLTYDWIKTGAGQRIYWTSTPGCATPRHEVSAWFYCNLRSGCQGSEAQPCTQRAFIRSIFSKVRNSLLTKAKKEACSVCRWTPKQVLIP